jgi:uncharacterized protein YecE (DUF72 family)
MARTSSSSSTLAEKPARFPKILGLSGWNGSQASYFQEFSSIEIQTTFYDPPKVRVAAKWRAIAPPEFDFCIKAWQLITHTASSPTYRRLRTPLAEPERSLAGSFQPSNVVWQAWQRTLEIAQTLDARIILFQCPKSFLPTSANLSKFMAFFRRIAPGQFQLAWEPRGEAWTEDLVRELCQECGLIHCVDPLTHKAFSNQTTYWRLHGLGSYSYQYTDSDLEELKRLVLGERNAGYLMFNNISAKADARRFRQILSQR